MGISPEIKLNFSAKNIEKENEVIDQIEELLPILPDGPKKDEIVLEYEQCLNTEDFKAVSDKIKELLKKIVVHQAQSVKKFFINKEKFFESNFSDIEKERSLKKINEIIIEALNNRMVNIGEGRVAKVFVSNKYPDFCYKIVTNNYQYNLGNDIGTEAEFMQDLVAIEAQGVRSPKPYYYKMDDKNHLLVMERFQAVSLDKILNNEYSLPPAFDHEKFFNSLEEYVNVIHGKGIYHRDLHAGNIMIDIQTFKPLVIDFGCAIKSFTSDPDNVYLIKDEYTGKAKKYPNDLKQISQLRNKFKKLLYNK